jgi:hypothetical protein
MDTNSRHRPIGCPAYLRGKPASEWIDAIAKRRRPREYTPLAGPRP